MCTCTQTLFSSQCERARPEVSSRLEVWSLACASICVLLGGSSKERKRNINKVWVNQFLVPANYFIVGIFIMIIQSTWKKWWLKSCFDSEVGIFFLWNKNASNFPNFLYTFLSTSIQCHFKLHHSTFFLFPVWKISIIPECLFWMGKNFKPSLASFLMSTACIKRNKALWKCIELFRKKGK